MLVGKSFVNSAWEYCFGCTVYGERGVFLTVTDHQLSMKVRGRWFQYDWRMLGCM